MTQTTWNISQHPAAEIALNARPGDTIDWSQGAHPFGGRADKAASHEAALEAGLRKRGLYLKGLRVQALPGTIQDVLRDADTAAGWLDSQLSPPQTRTIDLPESCDLPAGYRWGAHWSAAGRSGYYVIRESDDASVRAVCRPDIEMDADEIAEALEEALPWGSTRIPPCGV